MTAPARYAAYGLCISSDLELPLPPAAAGEPDVVLRAGAPGERPAAPIEGEQPGIVATYEHPGGRWYVAVREGEGHRLRFRGCGEFVLSADCSRIAWIAEPGERSRLLPILFAGTVLAFVLTLRGGLVLHASAVERGGRALAFVGQSGRGKSTLAALTAAAGARIVTDDVLLVDVDGGARCRGNAGELRLRAAARDLAAAFTAPVLRRETADERLAVRTGDAEGGWVGLGAIVVPRPSREAGEVSVRRLEAGDAVLWLLAFPRVHGLRDPRLLRRQFELLGALARQVAVYDVVVPWGPPFGAEIPGRLLGLLDHDAGGHAP